jgi:plastocyanin
MTVTIRAAVVAATAAVLLTPQTAAEAAKHHAARHHHKHHAKHHHHAKKKRHKATKATAAPSPRSTTTCTTSPSWEAGTADPFEQHVYAAHLERSPAQQVQDASDVSTYTEVHTALVEAMLTPTLTAGNEVTTVLQQSLDAFVNHVYAAHLEQSPTQQIAALMDPSTYTLNHTVLVEQMIKPVLDWVDELMAGTQTCTTTTTTSQGPPASAGAKSVDISGHMFMPSDLSVPTGTQVTWTNKDSDPHTVVADDGAFKSSTLNRGESYTYSFSSPGTFTYYCSVHPDMKAKVTVG